MEYGLIGGKLGHSYSKTIHELLCGYSYELCPLPTEADARAFLQRRQFKAINVSIPYKKLVMEYCSFIDPRARANGAVNTEVKKNGLLYGNNIRAVLSDQTSVNLGSVYESVVASELIAHGYQLFYYDNRTKGEVDYLIDDYESLSAVPIEVKSGKDYTVNSALNTFVQNEDYHIKKAFVVSNERKVTTQGKVTYLPIYDIMFFQNAPADEKDLYF